MRDTGLTGRKFSVDTYGGAANHGRTELVPVSRIEALVREHARAAAGLAVPEPEPV